MAQEETRLERFLREQKGEMKAALSEAEAEAAALDARRSELRALISSIRAALAASEGDSTPDEVEDQQAGRDLTLHGAMAMVLEGNPEGLTPRALTDEINKAGLYRKRDGSPVETNQIHARTNNYSQLFEKERGRIRLR